MPRSQLTDPDAVRANQAGQITRDQMNSLKSKFGSVPGWITVVLLFGLIGLTAVVVGKILTQSTPLAIGAVVVDIIITALITSWLGGIVARGRMGNLTVESAPGSVVWKNNQYVAESAGSVLESITGGMHLPPGDYTFYMLHGKNWLLSAEPAGHPVAPVSSGSPAQAVSALRALLDRKIDFDPKQSPEKSAQRVMEIQQAAEQLRGMDLSTMDREDMHGLMRKVSEQAMALTAGQGLQGLMQVARAAEAAGQQPVDATGVAELGRALEQTGLMNTSALEANRQGQLSGAQRGALLRDLQSNLLWAVLVFIGGIVFMYFSLPKQNYSGTLLIGAIAVLVVAALLLRVRHDLSDAMGGRVLTEAGLVTKYTRSTHSGRSSHTSYYCRVNNQHFEISRRASEALLEGSYRVYYTPNTKRLMNIEPLQAKPGS